MGIPATHLVLRFHGRVARSTDTLEECGLRPSRRIVEGNVVVDPTQTGGEYRMPSVLVVSIVNGEFLRARVVRQLSTWRRADETGELEREVLVRVARGHELPVDDSCPVHDRAWEGGNKPFLGGFRDKRSGLEYLHAA
jgi:hypothetical protein